MRKQKTISFAYCLLSILLTLSCLTACERKHRESSFLMTTIVEITVVGNSGKSNSDIDMAFKEIERIDRLMNVYSEDSEISRINNKAGIETVKVSEDTINVLTLALNLANKTEGALDITIAPLINLWGFGDDKHEIPPNDIIAKTIKFVDYTRLKLNSQENTVFLHEKGMKIDVSGIAKGYAVDRAIQILKERGVKNFLVNAGGDIYASGKPPGKDFWTIGIRHPRDSSKLLGVLKLKDKAVATSGDYENYFEVDGVRYCHILNPRTGFPVTDIMSATIIADTTAEADALATAIFPMGADKGMKMAEEMPGVEVIIVTGLDERNMKILKSSGIGEVIPAEFNMECNR
ncbi:FAD:protein FMN transferase [Candidatus Poribacteria bacterium]|nr:FAD:protein FMN transferase [Candidatus Poribacteria bacterium]